MELKTYLTIFSRRVWMIVIISILIMVAVVAIAANITPKYASTTRLRILTPIGGGTNYVDYDVYYATRLMNTYVAMATSSTVVDEIKQSYDLKIAPEIKADLLADSELIEITVTDTTPELSASIANSIANILVQYSLKPNIGSEASAEDILQKRLEELGTELDLAKSTYQQMIEPASQDNAQIAKLQQTIDRSQQVFLILKNEYENGILTGKSTFSLDQLENQMGLMEEDIIRMQTELETLNAKVFENTEQMTIAKRELDNKEQQYNTLVSQLDQVRITASIQGNTSILMVVDKATPAEKPTSPNMLLIYALGIVFSLFIGVLVAFVVDNLDDRLYSMDQIAAATKLEIIGKIPATEHLERTFLTANHDSYWESIHRLRINLLEATKDQPVKSLMFTSAEPHEGKSAIVASLAKEIAGTGSQVILLDTDLRLPTIQKYFNEDNQIGLSTYLEGEVTLDDVIKPSAVDHLSIITAGPISEQPAKLLGSQVMVNLLLQLKESFDYVLIDTPSILAVSDVDEIVSLVDGVILIVERGSARELYIESAIKQIEKLNAVIIGCIVNRAEVNYSSRYYLSPRNLSFFGKVKQFLQNR